MDDKPRTSRAPQRRASCDQVEAAAEVSTQRELEQSEQRFRALFDNAPEAVVIIDADVGTFVDANDNASRLFGLPKDELLSQGPLDLSPPTQPDGVPSADRAAVRIAEACAGGRPVFEWQHRNAAGEPIPCEVRLVRLPHPTRRLVRGSVSDISQRKRAEEENRHLAAQLFQAQKMEAIGQLTGGIAHDFNNLLTVITGSIAMLQMDAEDPVRVRSLAGHALEASERAAELTRRLLAFSRRQPLRPRVVELDAVLGSMEDLLRRTLGETIEVAIYAPGELWACTVDPVQLENVVLNLAINARDAMPEGGRLRIESKNVHLASPRGEEHDELAPGNYVVLSVADNGIGMSRDMLKHVFEPFYTTKAMGEGSGLGLSTVYGFAKQSGGHVEIDSEVGRGTVVALYLPCDAATTIVDTRGSGSPSEPVGGGEQVLVVEDDDHLRSLVVAMLKRLNYRALAAPDGARALELLQEAGNVELLLTDVVLSGGMDGVVLSQRARELHPALRLLFMSGYDDHRLEQPWPGHTLLGKPFSKIDLARAVRDAFGEPTG